MLHPQVAAAHVAGAPVVTSTMGTAPVMTSGVRPAHMPQGMGALGMHPPPMSIPTATVVPQVPSVGQDPKKRTFHEMERGKG